MTSKLQILANTSAQGLKRTRAAARRLRIDGISAPHWMSASLWIFPILVTVAWLLIRISDGVIALDLTGSMAAPMVTALCFKTTEMKRLISQALPILLFLCGLSAGQALLVTSIMESMRDNGIIIPGLSRRTPKGAEHQSPL